MSFKKWINFYENIIINDFGSDSALKSVEPNLTKEFNYQTEDGYSTFMIIPYQAVKLGHISISTSATHIGITKTTPIEPNNGVDIGFIKNLTQLLTGYAKPIPYKDTGDSVWRDVLKQSDDERLSNLFKNDDAGEFKSTETPDFKSGSSNVTKVSTISFSKASGSWSYFFRTSSSRQAINSVINFLKQAADPLIQNNLIDFYEIVDVMSRKREVVHSSSGQEKANNWNTIYNNNVAQLKFMAETMLKHYPSAMKLVLNAINGVRVIVSGGGKHPAADIQPKNYKIKYNDLIKFINESYAENIILKFFVNTVQKNNNEMYELLEKSSNNDDIGLILSYALKLQEDDALDYILSPSAELLYLGDAVRLMRYSNILNKYFSSKINKFKHELKEHIEKYLSDSPPLRESEVLNLKELSEYIDFSPQLIAVLDQLSADFKEKELKIKQKKEEQSLKQSMLVDYEESKYLVAQEDNKWKNIPYQYDRTNWKDIDIGGLAYNYIVDKEDVYMIAYDLAMDDAISNAEERPSENYGKDREEVEDDIEYYYDDFSNKNSLDIPEDISDSDLIELIKSNYYDDFIQWRIEKLKEEEEEDSWRYEPEPDSDDVNKYLDEVSEDIAYNRLGLTVLERDKKGNIEITLNSSFYQTVLPKIKDLIKANYEYKDPEFKQSNISISNKITIFFVDKKESKNYTVYDFINNKI